MDLRPAIRRWFEEVALTEVSFDGHPESFGVGVNKAVPDSRRSDLTSTGCSRSPADYRLAVPNRDDRPATATDVHDLAAGMPHVTVDGGSKGNAVYQVGGKSFVFFRTPRPDAFDPETGERYDDVIVIWVDSADEKEALVQDPDSPFFTTPHFDGHLSVLVRASRLGEVTYGELAELVQDAWLSRASKRRGEAWLSARR